MLADSPRPIQGDFIRLTIACLITSMFVAPAACTAGGKDLAEQDTRRLQGDGADPAQVTELDASTPPLFLVAGYLTTADEWVGYLAVVSDVSADGEVNLAKAIEFPDDMSFASPGGGEVYVGLGGSPIIQKWVLTDEESLELDDEVNLGAFGVTSALGLKNPLHFIDDDEAYFFDDETLQVIVWNPQTMETEEALSIQDLDEPDLWLGANYVHRDADRLLLTGRYWRGDDTAALLTKVAIIDASTREVTYATDERCGNVSFSAEDSAGNMYFASHTYQAAALAVGAAGDPPAPSCIIRILAGDTDFDPNYYVDLSELAEGHAGGIVQGPGDEAFVLVYAGPELTLDNYAAAQRESHWEYYAITLGSERDTFRKVENVSATAGYGLAFTLELEPGKPTPYVIAVDGAFGEGTYYDVSDADHFEAGLTLPGFPGNALVLRR